jgi:hypothetical protein
METHRAVQDATPDATPLLEAQIDALRHVYFCDNNWTISVRTAMTFGRTVIDGGRKPSGWPCPAVASRPWWRRTGSKA